MTPHNMIRIENKDYNTHPDQTGWYIMEYANIADMNNDTPCEVVGPFMTKTAAVRNLSQTNEVKDGRERESKDA